MFSKGFQAVCHDALRATDWSWFTTRPSGRRAPPPDGFSPLAARVETTKLRPFTRNRVQASGTETRTRETILQPISTERTVEDGTLCHPPHLPPWILILSLVPNAGAAAAAARLADAAWFSYLSIRELDIIAGDRRPAPRDGTMWFGVVKDSSAYGATVVCFSLLSCPALNQPPSQLDFFGVISVIGVKSIDSFLFFAICCDESDENWKTDDEHKVRRRRDDEVDHSRMLAFPCFSHIVSGSYDSLVIDW